MPRVVLVQLAAELGLNKDALRQRVKRQGIPTTKPLREGYRPVTIPEDAARALRAEYRDRRPATEAVGWPSATEAARMLGMRSREAFVNAVARGELAVERVLVTGKGQGGRRYRYNPADLRRIAAARGVETHRIPRGTLGTKAMAAVAGVSVTAVLQWGTRGCPTAQTSLRRGYWRPADVLAWLERQEVSASWSRLALARRTEQLERLRAYVAEHQPRRVA